MTTGHRWLLDAIELADDIEQMKCIERIIKFEKGEQLPYTLDETVMNELRLAWKAKVALIKNEVPSDVQTAK